VRVLLIAAAYALMQDLSLHAGCIDCFHASGLDSVRASPETRSMGEVIRAAYRRAAAYALLFWPTFQLIMIPPMPVKETGMT
jgi:hypothetical protein